VILSDDGVEALWAIYDATGVRPEYLAPVLYFESGFNPALPNAAGQPYYGIAQTSSAKLAVLGTTPAAFLAMSQGDQIRAAVAPYFAGVVKNYGPLRSATRAYQANFEPATLARVRSLAQIIEPHGTRAYVANAAALDPLRHGAITLGDLAIVMGRASKAPEVRAAVARAYALRPAAAPAREPVFGDDFAPGWGLAAGAAALGWVALEAFRQK
jgi:hypothetical protein